MSLLPFDEPAPWDATDSSIVIRVGRGREVTVTPASDGRNAVFMHYRDRIRSAPSLGAALDMAATFADETDEDMRGTA